MTRVAFWCLNVNVNSAVADVTAAGYGGKPIMVCLQVDPAVELSGTWQS